MSSYRVGIVGLSWITSEPANPGSHPVLGDGRAAQPPLGPRGDPICHRRRRLRHRARGARSLPAALAGNWPGVKTYADYAEMIRQERLDLVCVATPDDLHGDVVRMAADAGVRAIFCEKPISTHLADVDSMIEAIERNGAVATVNHTRRWMPSYVAAREKVRSGAIGELVTIVVNFGGERADALAQPHPISST